MSLHKCRNEEDRFNFLYILKFENKADKIYVPIDLNSMIYAVSFAYSRIFHLFESFTFTYWLLSASQTSRSMWTAKDIKRFSRRYIEISY